MKKKWTNSKVTILGLSKSGISAAEYLNSKGAECTISESRQPSEQDKEKISKLKNLGIEVEMGGNNETTIQNADIIITSPGIPPHSDVIKLAKNHKKEIISEIELTYRETTVPFIAITGTNGKTTTTKLVSEILEKAGYNAPTCGNIGIPACSLLNNSGIDYFVTEISSYQIEYSPTFKPQIALFLNYTPDHIDWHGSEQAYFRAKARLFTGARSPLWSILNSGDSNVLSLRAKTKSKIVYFSKETNETSVFINNDEIVYKSNSKIEPIIKLNDIPLIGEHNYQNIMAAIAIAKITGIKNNIIKSVVSEFAPPEHRLEYVDEIDGIKYYNDSKATNCNSTVWALKAFKSEKVVLIAGGRDKGTDLSHFVECIKEHASSVILFGEAADLFKLALKDRKFEKIHKTASLKESIDIAANLKEGSVLFSPACSSFDMFKNYEERGKAFKNYVIKKKQAE